MGYEYFTQWDSPNFTKGRKAGKPSFIVIHHWGNDGQKFANVVNYLCRANGNSSAHYVVQNSMVACIVDPDDTAWHAGSGGNPRGIGIECRPECSAGDKETVAELIADLRKTYGNLPLYPHKKFMATACPGRWEAQLGWLDKRANEILNGKKTSTPAKQSSTPAAKPATTSGAYKVKVSVSDLNIRKGPGTNYARTGKFTGAGVFTIVETKSGQGSKAGWGKLKSGAGWIALDYAKKV